jgi:hypothetical protein
MWTRQLYNVQLLAYRRPCSARCSKLLLLVNKRHTLERLMAGYRYDIYCRLL